MTFLGQTQLGLATALFTVLLGLSWTGDGFEQELWMYKEDGNYLHFHTHVPDLTEFSATLPKITTICRTGMWLLSTAVNYRDYYSFNGSGTSNTHCITENMTTVKSFRFFAASNTATDAISLYSGNGWEGEEIFVTTMAKTDISTPIKSLAATGTADWMLYEGKNFDGKSVCYQVPFPGYDLNWDQASTFNMTTIGSVFKGCDLDKIQLYRESALL